MNSPLWCGGRKAACTVPLLCGRRLRGRLARCVLTAVFFCGDVPRRRLQIHADVTGLPLVLTKCSDAPALGAPASCLCNIVSPVIACALTSARP